MGCGVDVGASGAVDAGALDGAVEGEAAVEEGLEGTVVLGRVTTNAELLLTVVVAVTFASVERTLTTARRPAWVGIIVHNTASASAPPMNPVVAVRPRPMVRGGSLVAHACAPISLGWRHPRSCGGTGALGYSSSSFPSLRSTKGAG